MNFSKKRLMKDIASLHNSQLEKSGIYFNVDENDMYTIYFLFIGGVNTPYEHGAFFFKIVADKQSYPFVPPVATFYSLSSHRMHPNFYTSGKVCLSILNTWAGPRWSPSQTLLSLAVTIQSVMDEFPLKHEPGYGSDIPEQINFNKFVLYENFKNIRKTLNLNFNPCFYCFNNELQTYYKKNISAIQEKLLSLSKSSPPTNLFLEVYDIDVDINYSKMMKKEKIYDVENSELFLAEDLP
jgi:ubiquitin-protein ligase